MDEKPAHPPTFDQAIPSWLAPRKYRYTCTKKEREEAQELAIIEAHGGSKWKTIGCMFLGLGVAMAALLLQAPAGWRWWVVGAVAGVTVLILVGQKLFTGGDSDIALTELEISRDSIRFGGGASSSVILGRSFEKLLESDNLFVLQSQAILLLLPKRVFEDDQEQVAFRALASDWTNKAKSKSEAIDSDSPRDELEGEISVQFQLGFRDYVDRTLMSWRPRAICALMLLLFVGVFIFQSFQPQPGAAFSPIEVLLYFFLPASPFFAAFAMSLYCVHTWLSERAQLNETRLTLGERGIGLASANDESLLSWEQKPRFKESSRSFYIWWPGTPAWTMAPKRAFQSSDDLNHFRTLLETYAEPSTWFWM